MDYAAKYDELLKYSNPDTAAKRLHKYLPGTKLYLSTRKSKKYMVQRPDGSYSHFGQIGYEDYTKHHDDLRRIHYLQRATKIKGNWKQDPYSSNNMSLHILW